MARIRSIKPDCWQHAKIGGLSRDARLFWVVLVTQADDDGRFRFLPSSFMGAGYPRDEDVSAALVREWMTEVENAGLVVTYQAGPDMLGQLHDWHDHQRINKKTDSKLPEPSGSPPVALRDDYVSGRIVEDSGAFDTSGSPTGVLPEPYATEGKRKGEEGKGEEAAARELAPEITSWLDRLFDEGRRQRSSWATNLELGHEMRTRAGVLLAETPEPTRSRVMRDFADAVASGRIHGQLPEALRGFLNRAETTNTPTLRVAPSVGQETAAARDAGREAAMKALQEARQA